MSTAKEISHHIYLEKNVVICGKAYEVTYHESGVACVSSNETFLATALWHSERSRFGATNVIRIECWDLNPDPEFDRSPIHGIPITIKFDGTPTHIAIHDDGTCLAAVIGCKLFIWKKMFPRTKWHIFHDKSIGEVQGIEWSTEEGVLKISPEARPSYLMGEINGFWGPTWKKLQ